MDIAPRAEPAIHLIEREGGVPDRRAVVEGPREGVVECDVKFAVAPRQSAGHFDLQAGILLNAERTGIEDHPSRVHERVREICQKELSLVSVVEQDIDALGVLISRVNDQIKDHCHYDSVSIGQTRRKFRGASGRVDPLIVEAEIRCPGREVDDAVGPNSRT